MGVYRIFAPILSLAITASAISTHNHRQQIEWLDCLDNVPLYFAENGIEITDSQLQSLPPTLHCGHLVVPMDYSKPLCEDNNITLSIAMHRPENPKSVIFLYV